MLALKKLSCMFRIRFPT